MVTRQQQVTALLILGLNNGVKNGVMSEYAMPGRLLK